MKNNTPKVSVMIVTYNQENLISETIDSVLSQDYPNLEIIVSDDCSTDSTKLILLNYQKRYPHIIYPIFNSYNLGITGNCNKALNACKGEFISILGGDDLFLPGKIVNQVKLFVKDPALVLSYHAVEVFWHSTGDTIFITNQKKKEEIHDFYDIIRKGGIPGASSVMIRRTACPIEGFNKNLPTVSDWLFYIEVAMVGKVKELKGVYGKYRKHGTGASDRSFELLDETLLTLDHVLKKRPDDKKLVKICSKGAFRYIMGEIYRQFILGDTKRLLYLKQKAMVYTDSLFQRYLIYLVLMCTKNKIIYSITRIILIRLKNTIKRYV